MRSVYFSGKTKPVAELVVEAVDVAAELVCAAAVSSRRCEPAASAPLGRCAPPRPGV